MSQQQDPTLLPRSVELSIQVLIVYSIITTVLETMPELAGYRSFFRFSEFVVVAIFTLEYLIRWYRSPDRLRYPLRPMAIIDLLAILPFYIRLTVDLRSLRALRLLRIFRLLKLGRYSRALQTLGEAFRRAGPELAVFGFIVLIVILLSSMTLYYAEHEAQPDVYESIPASLWWAVVTLTTVGYGDVYPVTPIGKVVASIVMLTGIGLIAIPAGVVSSHMTEIIREVRDEGTHETNGT